MMKHAACNSKESCIESHIDVPENRVDNQEYHMKITETADRLNRFDGGSINVPNDFLSTKFDLSIGLSIQPNHLLS